MKEGQYLSDDVPFSCCNADAHRPCIHHGVHTNSKHYNYDYANHITLNKIGCTEALMKDFGQYLQKAGGLLLFLFFLQVKYHQNLNNQVKLQNIIKLSVPNCTMKSLCCIFYMKFY